MQKIKKLIPLGAALLPFIAFAQTTFGSILGTISTLVSTLTTIAMAVAFLVFLYGVIRFITAGGDEEKRKTAKNLIIYGLIGLFVMVAVWGLVAVLASTFGVTTGGTTSLPTI
ncbi:MAG: hypothetical protein AAB491_00845 [Patescibacteria group bacterium]